MKRILFAVGVLFMASTSYATDITWTDKTTGGTFSATDANEIKTAVNSKADKTASLVGDCTVGPCLDGSTDGGNFIKLWAGTGSYWTALQGGAPAANRSWRLPILAPPSAGETNVMTMDENGQMAFLDKPSTTGYVLSSTDAGVLSWAAPSSGGGYTNLTSFVAQTPWRVFYSNTDGDVTELALGADGTYLKSNGATSAPTFATPSGSGDMVLATAQSVTGKKTFDDTMLAIKGGSTGVTTFDSANAGATNYTINVPAANATLATTSDIIAPLSTVRTTAGGGSTTAASQEAAIGDALALKANVSNISFVAGVLSDMKIVTTTNPTGETWLNDSYAGTQPTLILASKSYIDSGLSGKQASDSDLTTWSGITPGTGVGTFLGTPTIANFFTAVTGEGAFAATLMGYADAAAVTTGLGLTIGTNTQSYDADLTTWAGVTPGSGVATFLATPSSANLATALTGETGSGAAVFGTSPTLSGVSYPTVTSTSTATGNINIDGVSADHYYFNNGATAASYIPVLTSRPATGYERGIVLTIGGGSGICTLDNTTTPIITWLAGTAPTLVTTTNKKLSFGCLIPSTGNAQCWAIGGAHD